MNIRNNAIYVANNIEEANAFIDVCVSENLVTEMDSEIFRGYAVSVLKRNDKIYYRVTDATLAGYSNVYSIYVDSVKFSKYPVIKAHDILKIKIQKSNLFPI